MEYTLQNKTNLKEWGWTEEEVVNKAASSSEQRVVLKTKKDGAPSPKGLFNFYQSTKELVLQKASNIFSVKVITEKKDTNVGGFLIAWIVFMLLYYLFLIAGFKRNNNALFTTAATTAAAATTVVAAAVAVTVVAVAAAVAVTVVAVAVVVATLAVVAIAAAEKQDKKGMFIISFLYYVISLLLFYAVSDLSHTSIPMVAVPVVSALTWWRVKYKN